MGLMDILKDSYEALSGDSSKTSGSGNNGRGIFGKILEIIGLKKPEIGAEAREASESAEKERGSLFGEIGKSLFLRQFPQMAAMTDIGKQLTGSKEPEVVSWQNEFETISAFLLLVPGSWKHYLTDFFANSTIFRTLVEHWPGLDGVNLTSIPLVGQLLGQIPGGLAEGGNIRKRVLQDKDPNAVIAALRVMHQDLFVTGKVSFDKIKDMLSGTNLGAAAEILGGALPATA